MSDEPVRAERLFELAGMICDGSASDTELSELDACLRDDPLSRDRYLGYCWMHVSLATELQMQQAVQQVHRQISAGPVIPPVIVANDFGTTAIETPVSAPVSVPAMIWRNSMGFVSSGWPVAYMVATVVLGIGIVVGLLLRVSAPVEVVSQRPAVAKNMAVKAPQQEFVGHVTGMADCRFAADSKTEDQTPMTVVHLGDRFVLTSGLMEITYATGARVILQGPVTYEVESPVGGYLSVGKLTARVGGSTGYGVLSTKKVISKSEIRNPKSETISKSPNLQTSKFIVRTPTATVTDLGTEFGVEVAKSGETISHVFRGSVRVQVVAVGGQAEGRGKVLRENESVQVDGSQGSRRIVVAPAATAARFLRVMPKPGIKTFDLVDVVAGGDGFSGRRGRGIDPTNGRSTDTTLKDYNGVGFPIIVSDGKYHRVEALPLVDGVFVPNGRSGAVQVDSAGHTFADFGRTDDKAAGNIWAGGAIPVPSSSMPSAVSSLLSSLPPSQTLLPTKLGGIDYAASGHGLIFMHANNGITFDLEAIRRANPGLKLLRFHAAVGNVEPVSERGEIAGYADVWVLVDGQVRFRRREINGCSGAFPILFPVADNDRFLTLVATDSGNTMAGDWILFGDPSLEMVTHEQKGESK
jgi:hypothetical protein